MRTITLLTLVGVALAAPNSPSPTQHRIVGGLPTTVDRYPYIVNMQFNLWDAHWQHFCGGSLITVNSVLSAAHCAIVDGPWRWRARLGTSWSSSGGDVINIAQIIIHGHYTNPTLSHDVAIYRLASPAVLSDTIQLARIAGPNYNVPDGTRVETLGWGALYSGGGSPEQLQVVEINTINHQICAERYAYLKTQPGYERFPQIDDSMLCAGVLDVGGRDACNGDSGGPLAHLGDIIIGIVSGGFECADPFYPGVNARVSFLSDWIVQHATG